MSNFNTRREFVISIIAGAVASVFPEQKNSYWISIEESLRKHRENTPNLFTFGIYESFRYIESK